ncbi:MAG: methylmalonyl-CoA mutase family protein [Candidatus Poribacteria bacterium]
MFNEELSAIRKAKTEWETRLKKSEDQNSIRPGSFTTWSDMSIPLLNSPDDLADMHFNYLRDLGFPGEFPYTRGVYYNMYRGRLWTMRQFAGFATAEKTNERFKLLLQHGQTGLSVAFDMPTLMGYDADSPLGKGEVGKCGVSVSSLEDMERLFDGIPLGEVTTSMTINGPAIVILAMYLAVAEKKGVPREKVRGTLQNDILKEYIAQKEWLFPITPAVRLVVDTIENATKYYPNWNTISISGYHIREAGATAIQELAFTIANGLAYVDACIERGLSIDEFAPRLSFFFDVHNDFFEEIAKFRAARRLWARLIRDKYDPKDPKSCMLRTHAQTAGVSLTAQQPHNNIVRVAIQGLAAVLGGTNSLHTNSMDETLALPTDESVMIALRTQQILAEESGVANVVDPFGGSYFMESLTTKMEQEAEKYLNKIAKMGGMVAAIEAGFPQIEISNSAYHFQRLLEENKKIMVGMNKYKTTKNSQQINTLYIDKSIEHQQVSRLAALKNRRSNTDVLLSLTGIAKAASSGDNLVEPIISAVKKYATLQEICDVLRKVFGKYKEQRTF